jgi:P27 family predicted phage terminase small subunit
MARTPQPAALLLLKGRGNGKDSAGRPVPVAPKFARQAPEPPEWLSDEARAEWDRVVPGLEALDLLKESDRAVLVAYCETWATYCETLAAVREGGYTVVNHSTRKDGSSSEWVTKNPAVAVMETSATSLRAFASEFGLSPAGERKISRAPSGPAEEESDPYAASQ